MNAVIYPKHQESPDREMERKQNHCILPVLAEGLIVILENYIFLCFIFFILHAGVFCLYVHLCTTCVPCVHRVLKQALASLELQHVGAGS